MSTTTKPMPYLFAAICAATLLVPGVAASAHPSAAPRYELIDVGTFGGPHADVVGPARQITADGAVLGIADTRTTDQDFPNDGIGGPYIFHAFAFRQGRLDDLGALPGNNSSTVFEINRHGLGVGASETGSYDPAPTPRRFTRSLFRHGTVTDIGTLPGGSEGFAVSVNDRGQVVGLEQHPTLQGPGQPDFFDWGGQIRSFVWHDGVMRDLGTPRRSRNRRQHHQRPGQIAGDSYVDGTVNPTTGFPTLHPFIWQHGRMRDLGSLGGARTLSYWMNEHGQVVGKATLPGDQITHPFFWDGHRMRDLGTLGGAYAEADRINDHGVIAGFVRPAGNTTDHTFVWRNGVMTDLVQRCGPMHLPGVDQQPQRDRRSVVRGRSPALARWPAIRPEFPRRPDQHPADRRDLHRRPRTDRRSRAARRWRPARLPVAAVPSTPGDVDHRQPGASDTGYVAIAEQVRAVIHRRPTESAR